MALDALEQEQQARLEALEYTVNLLWREMAYIKNILEDIRTKTD
jgi:hypothetical protein